MSEGELKKRLLEFGSSPDQADYIDDSMSAVYAVLDEAKKEIYTQIPYAGLYPVIKKWFGDP